MTPVDPSLMEVGWTYVVIPDTENLPALVGPDGTVCTEWELTEEEMQRLICGGRIRILAQAACQPLPIHLEVLEPEFPGAES